MDKERTERNFFQLERDKVNSFWEISQRQVEEARATVRNKERELGDAEERHQVEIKVRRTLSLLQDVCIHWGWLICLARVHVCVCVSLHAGLQTESEAPAVRAPEQHY